MSSKHSTKKHSRTSPHGNSSSKTTSSKSKSSGKHRAASYFPTFPTTTLSFSPSGGSSEGWVEEDEHAGGGGYYMNYPVSHPHGGDCGDGGDGGDDFSYVPDADAGDDDNDQAGDEHYPDSMTSSVRAHRWEGGFRYHAYREGRYCFPNDEVEQNCDDMKHKLALSLCDGRLFYAPIKDRLAAGANVLDLGTGTGIWAIQLADKYLKSNICGVDLSPIQPDTVPPRVSFGVDDFEDDWIYPANHFDYVHMRHTLHSVHDRRRLLRQAYRHLKPGGYIEFQEFDYVPRADDGSLTTSPSGKPRDYALSEFYTHLRDGMKARSIGTGDGDGGGGGGADPHAIAPGRMDAELEAAGFRDVTRRTHKCPIGRWSSGTTSTSSTADKKKKSGSSSGSSSSSNSNSSASSSDRQGDIGAFHAHILLTGLPGLAARPFGPGGLNWPRVRTEVFLVGVRQAIMDPSFHAYFNYHVVFARKPAAKK